MTTSRVRRTPTRNVVASATGAANYSLLLAVVSVPCPYWALGSGYSASGIAALTVDSANPPDDRPARVERVMRRYSVWIWSPRRPCCSLPARPPVAASPSLLPFVSAEVLQGV